MFSYEFCEISKNTFFYRTLPLAASVQSLIIEITQTAITCSKLTIVTLEQDVKLTPCSNVSIVNFEPVNAECVKFP